MNNYDQTAYRRYLNALNDSLDNLDDDQTALLERSRFVNHQLDVHGACAHIQAARDLLATERDRVKTIIEYGKDEIPL